MLGEGFAHNPRTLLHIAPYLRSRSVSPIEIFKRAGISPSTLLDANGWVPRELCFRLGNEMRKVTGERFLGADVGRSLQASGSRRLGRGRVRGARRFVKRVRPRSVASVLFIRGPI